MAKKILIIGCARSGTTYISKIFQEIGFDVRHEKFGVNGTSDWHRTVGDFGNEIITYHSDFDIILHQVRYPLDVIASMLTIPKSTWESINRHIPLTLFNVLLDSMRYWYFWNLIAYQKSIFTYRVEEISSDLDIITHEHFWWKICNILGLKVIPNIPKVSNKINSREHKKLTWNDLNDVDKLLTLKIIDLSRSFGY